MHKIEKMSYGGGTWYMDSTHKELKIMIAFGYFHWHN